MKPESHFHVGHERVRSSGMTEPARVHNVEAEKIGAPRRPEVRRETTRAPRPPKMMAEPKAPKLPRERSSGVPRQLRGRIALPPGEQAYIPSDAEYP